jgi:ribonuclease HII
MMIEHDRAHPGYGWASNKGYGTLEHRDALTRLGPTPLHRRSFAPVRAINAFAVSPAATPQGVESPIRSGLNIG